MRFASKFLKYAGTSLDDFLKRAKKIPGVKVLAPGSTPSGIDAWFLMLDGCWLCGDGFDSPGHPGLAEAVGEKELLRFNPVRVVSPTEFDFLGNPTVQQRREVARMAGTSTRVIWDFRLNTGKRINSGSGTLGDMLRALDTTFTVVQ